MTAPADNPRDRNAQNRARFRGHRRELGLALLAALVVRLLCLALVTYRTDLGDAADYLQARDNIALHGAMSDAHAPPYEPALYRPPLYPGFLALMRVVFGPSPVPVQLLQCLLGTVAVGLMASAASAVSRSLGRWALWVLALSPFDAVFNGAILTESLVIFLLAASMAAPFLLRSWWRWPVTGVLFGLTALTRDVQMLLIPAFAVIAAWAFVHGLSRRQRLGIALGIALGGALTIAPWTTRNYVVKHQFIPISRGTFARALWYGTWVRDYSHYKNDALGLPRELPPWAFELPDERELWTEWDKNPAEVERDRVFMGMFKRRLEANPAAVVVASLHRAPRLWVGTTRFDIFPFRPGPLQPGRPLYLLAKLFLFGLNVAGVALGMIGIGLAALRRNLRMLWFALPVVYTIAVLAPLDCIESRYTQPVYACLLVMACLTLRTLRVAWRRRGLPRLRLKSAASTST